MAKVIVVSNNIDLNYTDNTMPTSGGSLIHECFGTDAIVFNTDYMVSSDWSSLQTYINDKSNYILTLGQALETMATKVTNLDYTKLQNIEGTLKYDTNTLLKSYLSLESTKNLLKSSNYKAEVAKGTITEEIEIPGFTEPEPTFNETMPTFTSDLEEVTKFSYYFGMDNLQLLKNDRNSTCCFVSSELAVNNIGSDGYIQIDADYNADEYSSIEFYIIDGQVETPIMPYKDTQIINEKIFFDMYSRFTIDTNKNVVVSKNLTPTTIKFKDAITLNDDLYTVSYTPKDCYTYKPSGDYIRIKVIMRMYDIDQTPPYINYINIMKFGGTNLWQESI